MANDNLEMMDDDEKFEIKITNDAIERINKLRNIKQKQNNDTNDYTLKIFIDSGGCSGFQYNFEIVSE